RHRQAHEGALEHRQVGDQPQSVAVLCAHRRQADDPRRPRDLECLPHPTMARVSGKPGAGAKSPGIMTKTPSTPVNAACKAAAAANAAPAPAAPGAAQDAAWARSRTMARRPRPRARRARAVAPPTRPVIPVIANIDPPRPRRSAPPLGDGGVSNAGARGGTP